MKYCQLSLNPYQKMAVSELSNLETKMERIEELTYVDYARVTKLDAKSEYIQSNLSHLTSLYENGECQIGRLQADFKALVSLRSDVAARVSLQNLQR